MEYPPKERRKTSRIYRNFILSYHEKGKPMLSHEVSQVNNVSRGGANFSSTRTLGLGTLVTMELKTPFLADPLRLEGEVMECREKIPGIIFEIRLQFKNLSSEALVVLEKIENYEEPRG